MKHFIEEYIHRSQIMIHLFIHSFIHPSIQLIDQLINVRIVDHYSFMSDNHLTILPVEMSSRDLNETHAVAVLLLKQQRRNRRDYISLISSQYRYLYWYLYRYQDRYQDDYPSRWMIGTAVVTVHLD
mmetsp:Transcript_16391/g.31046  ORF Transcript_16391/g.31046 Transcript_16391/m.31046 type:complete len:127 (+) Transcript_16391:580-960(+)